MPHSDSGYAIESQDWRTQIEQYLALRDTDNGPHLPDEEEEALLFDLFGAADENGVFGGEG